MARARDMLSVLQVTLVWLLALIVVPIGGGPSELERDAETCESWCPCDEPEREAIAEHAEVEGDEQSPCDEDCGQECSGCCEARTPVAVGLEGMPSTLPCAVSTNELPTLDAPGCRVATDVFRPPRSLT